MTTSQADIDALFAQAGEVAPSRRAEPNEAAGPAPAPAVPGSAVQSRTVSRKDVHRILGLSLPVAVTLAERDLAVEMILAFRVGTIVEFDVPFDAELSLCVSNQPIGKGHAVKVGENFGLRVTSIDTVEHRIEALKGGSS